MLTVNTHEAKTKLSSLLAIIEEKGETVQVCRHGKPIAIIQSFKQTINPLKQHKELQGMKLHYDPVSPLSKDEWPEDMR